MGFGVDGRSVWVGAVVSSRCRRGWASGYESGHEDGPRWEDAAGGDGAQVLEESHSGSKGAARFPPGGFYEVVRGVHGEGQQVEDRRHAGEGLPAMPEIVFEVVAIGFMDIEGLVFDLPAGASAGGERGDVSAGDGEVGNEAVSISDLAVEPGDLDLQPVDAERIRAVSQRHIGHPAVAVNAPGRPPAPGLAGFVEGDPVPVFARRLVACRLAHEEEPAADGARRFADRLPGAEVVAQADRPQPGERRSRARQPAARRPALAVLLCGAVLRAHELGRRRQRPPP